MLEENTIFPNVPCPNTSKTPYCILFQCFRPSWVSHLPYWLLKDPLKTKIWNNGTIWLFRISHSTMSYSVWITTINKSIQENFLRYKILLENTMADKIFGTTMNFWKYINIFSKLAPPLFHPINVVFVMLVAGAVSQSFSDSNQSGVYFSHLCQYILSRIVDNLFLWNILESVLYFI